MRMTNKTEIIHLVIFPIIILKKDVKHDGETYNWEQLALADQDYLESI